MRQAVEKTLKVFLRIQKIQVKFFEKSRQNFEQETFRVYEYVHYNPRKINSI